MEVPSGVAPGPCQLQISLGPFDIIRLNLMQLDPCDAVCVAFTEPLEFEGLQFLHF